MWQLKYIFYSPFLSCMVVKNRFVENKTFSLHLLTRSISLDQITRSELILIMYLFALNLVKKMKIRGE